MKKVAVIILFNLHIYFCAHTQEIRLSRTEWEIRSEFSDKIFKVEYSDGIKIIYFENPDYVIMYWLNDKRICTMCTIIPQNNRILNEFITMYNKELVVISDTEWRLYQDGYVIQITLFYETSSGFYSFIYNYLTNN